jgi:glucosamine--fructose-6-phosphate aminotransferase (isomerizing)
VSVEGVTTQCTTDAASALTVRFYVPLQVLGLGEGRTFIASETSAFSRYTKNFIAMKDGEIGVVHASGTTLDISRLQVSR